jgi:hypothetical protein
MIGRDPADALENNGPAEGFALTGSAGAPMSLQAAPQTLPCSDCGAEIGVDAYRRKIPRCDDCEVLSALRAFEHESVPPGFVRVFPSHRWSSPQRWRLQLRMPALGVRVEWSVWRG